MGRAEGFLGMNSFLSPGLILKSSKVIIYKMHANCTKRSISRSDINYNISSATSMAWAEKAACPVSLSSVLTSSCVWVFLVGLLGSPPIFPGALETAMIFSILYDLFWSSPLSFLWWLLFPHAEYRVPQSPVSGTFVEVRKRRLRH